MGTAANEDCIVLRICENALYGLTGEGTANVKKDLLDQSYKLRKRIDSLEGICKINPETPCNL
jgi:hypothetical protein